MCTRIWRVDWPILHELMSVDPAAVPVAPTNIRNDLLAHLKLQQDGHDTPELVGRGAEILQSQILRLRAEPTRLIHGDFSHPNLRVDGQTNRLIGVLDHGSQSDGTAALSAPGTLPAVGKTSQKGPRHRRHAPGAWTSYLHRPVTTT